MRYVIQCLNRFQDGGVRNGGQMRSHVPQVPQAPQRIRGVRGLGRGGGGGGEGRILWSWRKGFGVFLAKRRGGGGVGPLFRNENAQEAEEEEERV